MVVLESIKDLIWSPPMLGFIAIVSIYMTFLLRGLQFRYLKYSLVLAFLKREQPSGETTEKGDISHFQALMTSLAAAIGTGNIVGVATALTTGGLGSLFWMWIIAFLGMALKYSEALLAVKYRVENEQGEMSGGPMYYLKVGAGANKLALGFAFCGAVATFGTGNMVQVHSVGEALHVMFDIPPMYTGISLSLITAFVLLGGVRSIGRVAEILVPAMASLYLFGGLYVILTHSSEVGTILWQIVQNAFGFGPLTGGVIGASLSHCLQVGVSRSIFSNEAGLGTSSIASAAAKTDYPGRQAMVAMTSAFLSTIIVCTVTALVVALSGSLGTIDPQTGSFLNGAPLALQAFGTTLPGGRVVVTLGLVLFAYSTIVGWAYYGEKCIEFLIGSRYIFAYRLFYILCMIPASILQLSVVWTVADISNGLMILPNLLGLLLLRKVIRSETDLFCKILKNEAKHS